MMSRRQRQIERLGGIPDTGPAPDTEIGVLEPTEDNELDRPVEVTATFRYHDGRLSGQELEVETPDVDLNDDIRHAANRQLDRYEF